MELQQLRYVLAVAETHNFTRAASRCFVVQSVLSHQIKALERELGVALFARTSRRVEITAAGLAFLPAARAALDAVERAAVDAAAATGQIRGRLTIGVIPTVTAVDVPAAVAGFRRLHPDVQVTLHTAGSDELIDAIDHGRVDVAVLGLAEHVTVDRVATRVLARDRLVAVVDAGHRLARRRRISVRDLADETFADFPAGSPGRVQSDLAFEQAGLDRTVAFEAMGTDLVLGLVAAGCAVALLPRGCAVPEDTVRVLSLSDGPVRVEYLAWNAFNPTPAGAAFLASLA